MAIQSQERMAFLICSHIKRSSKVKRLISVIFLAVFVFGAAGGRVLANGITYPHESGIKGLIHVMEAKLDSKTRVKDIYRQIDSMGPIYPNQIWCRADIMVMGSKVYRKVFWSVWYRPEAFVSADVECVDTYIKVSAIPTWLNKQNRQLTSNAFEAHTDLIYLYQKYSQVGSYRWCRSNYFGFETYESGNYILSPRMEKVIFSGRYASSLSFVYTSRDVICTNDISEYYKWKRNKFWREIG